MAFTASKSTDTFAAARQRLRKQYRAMFLLPSTTKYSHIYSPTLMGRTRLPLRRDVLMLRPIKRVAQIAVRRTNNQHTAGATSFLLLPKRAHNLLLFLCAKLFAGNAACTRAANSVRRPLRRKMACRMKRLHSKMTRSWSCRCSSCSASAAGWGDCISRACRRISSSTRLAASSDGTPA